MPSLVGSEMCIRDRYPFDQPWDIHHINPILKTAAEFIARHDRLRQHLARQDEEHPLAEHADDVHDRRRQYPANPAFRLGIEENEDRNEQSHQIELHPEDESEEIAAEHDKNLTRLELRIVKVGKVLDGHQVEDEDHQAE